MTQSTRKSSAGFNRREFLQGSGAVAAATALSPQSALAQDAAGPIVVQEATTITLNVNGAPRQVTVEPRTTLLEALRYQLDLTGCKPVSSDGSSGASTVFVNDRPVMASTTLAITVRDQKITTVESLNAGGNLDPVPAAFVEHDAQQCGFCTPGFVMAVRAFLNQNPNATEQQIREGLNGNICRCGTYANIIQAAISLARGA
jgi:aerobic-type carbon monoxide dehydrogenase small subunit (CoxS/CutS family)